MMCSSDSKYFIKVRKWVEKISARPAVQKGLEVCKIEDRSVYGTFTKPENLGNVDIFDMASQIKILRQNS
jgi:hypothetical protein